MINLIIAANKKHNWEVVLPDDTISNKDFITI